MSKILIIPDMHLKPAMLDMAERILAYKKANKIVILGDLLDDFYAKPEDYERFWQKFMQFYEERKDQIVLLYGNHEVAYLIGRHVTGNIKAGGKYADLYAKLHPGIAYIDERVVFSHAGIFDEFLRAKGLEQASIDEAVHAINALPLQELWLNASPLWARPQCRVYHNAGQWLNYVQVVGHTPMRKIKQDGAIISVDVFSTDWGKKYGEERMIIIDTLTGKYEITA
jgi:hypothetical protein